MSDEQTPGEETDVSNPVSTVVEEAQAEEIPPRLLELAQKLEAALQAHVTSFKKRH